MTAARHLTAAADKIVRLWNLRQRLGERDYVGLTLPIISLTISGNRAFTIAAASADKTVTPQRNAADAKVLKKLSMHARSAGGRIQR